MNGNPRFARHENGFTLLELLVSMSIILLLLAVLGMITSTTQRTWAYTSGKAEQFRDAREAFESMTRQLSQATLNTYWDYDNPNAPTRYLRQSELRFISGGLNAMTATATYSNFPSHAVFFQAPLGYVTNTTSYSDLYSLLNTWGFFIEFGSNKPWNPNFLNSLPNPPAQRYRFRLMQMMEPSESLTLYNSESQTAGGNANYVGTDWFTTPLASTSNLRIVADNIIALVLLPKLTPQEDSTGTALSPNYSYNSVKTDDNNDPAVSAATDWKNQLPPEVQVTMVAVDEASYKRFQGNSTTMPNLLVDTSGNPLFQKAGDLVNSSNPGYAQDLQSLQNTLVKDKLNYRVFSTNVSIKAAKWSRDQTN